jgi:hypothetical protein
MNYYYKKNDENEQKIINEETFTVITGKSSGNKVGEMRFETERITNSLLAGEYKAILHVTVSAN